MNKIRKFVCCRIQIILFIPFNNVNFHEYFWCYFFCHSDIQHMEPRNNTHILEFFLLGFSQDPNLQPVICGLFLSMYLITVVGNLLIILTIISDANLHTPMYFFLSNLSFVDICFVSTTVPKMLVNIQTKRKSISYADCIT